MNKKDIICSDTERSRHECIIEVAILHFYMTQKKSLIIRTDFESCGHVGVICFVAKNWDQS